MVMFASLGRAASCSRCCSSGRQAGGWGAGAGSGEGLAGSAPQAGLPARATNRSAVQRPVTAPAVVFAIVCAVPPGAHRVAITPQLLARLASLDDLLELAAALGYAPGGDELNAAARARLGPRTARAGHPSRGHRGHHASFTIYGMVADTPPAPRWRGGGAPRAGHPRRAETSLLVLDTQRHLAVAAVAPRNGGFARASCASRCASPARLRRHPRRPGRGPRDTALSLAVRRGRRARGGGLTRRFFKDFARLHALAAERWSGIPHATSSERRDLALVVLTRVLFL